MRDFDLAKEWERLASLGYAPQLIYDDNGNFCVADEGCGRLRQDDDDSFSFTLWGESSGFEKSPEAAWKNYIERLRSLGDEV